MKTLEHWLSILERRHPVEIELGLDRISQVAESLDIGNIADKVVMVAGTNGKGSCVRAVESLALAGGLRVGTYTSPHLLRYNERVRINGLDVADADFCRAFEQIDAHRGDTPLTYFEVGTLAALLIMAESELDIAVLEVGLGGRFDAVNIIDADVAVITSIALDHEHWLGRDREKIAVEKAGIVRRGRPVVCAESDPPAGLYSEFERVGAQPLFIGSDFGYCLEERQLSLTISGEPGGEFHQLPLPRLPLPSVAAAVQALALAGVTIDDRLLAKGLENLQLVGRFQELHFRNRRLILDVAHNPAAAHYLAAKLSGESGPVFVVAALMADKDVAGFVEALSASVDRWFVGNLGGIKRALPAVELGTVLAGYDAAHTVKDSVEEAFEMALGQLPETGSLVVCGSFFTLSAILKYMGIENAL